MVYYYLGSVFQKMGDPSRAVNAYREAASQPPDLVFPFRLEAYAALSDALSVNPKDTIAHYYLGNLLFENQPDEAIQHWERARSLDPDFAGVHRNLGIAYSRIRQDNSAAVLSLERAVKCDPSDSRLFLELDQFYEAVKAEPAKRLGVLETNQPVVDRNDTLCMREASLLVQVGHYDRAIEMLDSRHFHVWEGGGQIHDIFVDAHLARGQLSMHDQEFSKALADFNRALDYPFNLEVGKSRDGGRDPEIYYYIAMAEEALGMEVQAREHFEVSATDMRPADSPLAYFQALSLGKLGKSEQAIQLLNKIIQLAEERLEAGDDDRFFAKFGERESNEARLAQAHFLLGLGLLGKGQKSEAKGEFQTALSLNPNHLQARRQLADL
jgi:tetratricopeptide (TPR) repeat protein